MTTSDTPGPITVTADFGACAADISVTAGARAETIVQVSPRTSSRPADVRAAEQMQVEFVDGKLMVQLWPLRRFLWFGDSGAVDVTIEVPIGSELDLTSGMGDLRCRGEFGAAKLKTGMGSISIDHCGPLRAHSGFGDITAERVTGSLDAVTGSGRVRVGDVDGDAVVRNGNGDTAIGGVTGHLRAKAGNGEILVDQAGGSVNAKSANGAIRLGEVSRDAITIATSAGPIDVGVRPGVAAWLDVSTKHGRVRSELDAAGDPGDAGSTVEVRARTSFGDITIRRSAPTA
jgi:DUF4097 and DUF4098 domain-containing protein YvlB